MSSRILVVDDDPRLREVVRYALSRAGFDVQEASDGAQALAAFRAAVSGSEAPDLIVLDVMMPEMDGLSVCREIRKDSEVPIVFLSSKDEELDRILGLELGGDDYVTKPFSPRELVSRVKAVLRRAKPREAPAQESEVLSAGGVRMDLGQFRVWGGETEVTLTVTEFRILQVLLRHPGRPTPATSSRSAPTRAPTMCRIAPWTLTSGASGASSASWISTRSRPCTAWATGCGNKSPR